MTDLPPLRTDPKYGYFPWWPEEGEAWIHPEDVATARSMIPSGRIFRRDGGHPAAGFGSSRVGGEFMLLHYGEVTLRIRPTLWQEVEPEGFEIGDWVEVLSRGLANEPRTGKITEIEWEDHAAAIRYQIVENGQPIETRYACDDLKHVERTAELKSPD